MGISCIQSTAGKMPANLETFTPKEMKSAQPLIRGVWKIPGRGVFCLYEGEGARLHLKSCHIGQGGEGYVSYEKEDGSLQAGADVLWHVAGKKVIITPSTWACWSSEDREVFQKAAKEAGLEVSVRRNLTIVRAVGVVAFFSILLGVIWHWENGVAAEKVSSATVSVAGDVTVVQCPQGHLTMKTVGTSTLVVEVNGGELAMVTHCSSGHTTFRVEGFVEGLIKAGKVFPILTGKELKVLSYEILVVGGAEQLQKIAFTY